MELINTLNFYCPTGLLFYWRSSLERQIRLTARIAHAHARFLSAATLCSPAKNDDRRFSRRNELALFKASLPASASSVANHPSQKRNHDHLPLCLTTATNDSCRQPSTACADPGSLGLHPASLMTRRRLVVLATELNLILVRKPKGKGSDESLHSAFVMSFVVEVIHFIAKLSREKPRNQGE